MPQVCLLFPQSRGEIAREIYGHFAEHIGGVFYDGLYVGEDSPVENVRGFRKALVEAFRRIEPPVLRWPGGCFAETYDWRDGIGPKADRPTRVNWWYCRDGRTEPNQVGTHEFMDFCRMAGTEPYVAANVTTVPALHIRNWVEYCNFPQGSTTLARERERNGDPAPFGVRYWGIGNENWGGGGQMSPEMYAREFIRYATVVNDLDEGGYRFIACGPNADDLAWTQGFMREYGNIHFGRNAELWGLSLHYYCGAAGDVTGFTADQWDQQLDQAFRMQALIDAHRAAMDAYDPERRIGLVVDEWGCWHPDGSGPSQGYNLFEQQSTLRDAMVSALTLNIFNNRCDVVRMANVAQLCNNLHCLFLAGGEHLILTPTYHVFDLFKTHQGARQIAVATDAACRGPEGLPNLSVSASQREDLVTITLANTQFDQGMQVQLSAFGGSLRGDGTLTLLTGDPHDHNTFEHPDRVRPQRVTRAFTGGDVIDLPAASVAAIVIRRERT